MQSPPSAAAPSSSCGDWQTSTSHSCSLFPFPLGHFAIHLHFFPLLFLSQTCAPFLYFRCKSFAGHLSTQHPPLLFLRLPPAIHLHKLLNFFAPLFSFTFCCFFCCGDFYNDNYNYSLYLFRLSPLFLHMFLEFPPSPSLYVLRFSFFFVFLLVPHFYFRRLFVLVVFALVLLYVSTATSVFVCVCACVWVSWSFRLGAYFVSLYVFGDIFFCSSAYKCMSVCGAPFFFGASISPWKIVVARTSDWQC